MDLGYTCKDDYSMLIERKKKKNKNYTRNNNGKGFENYSGKVCFRFM